MDTSNEVEVNPLELTLDEFIAINFRKNQNAEMEESNIDNDHGNQCDVDDFEDEYINQNAEAGNTNGIITINGFSTLGSGQEERPRKPGFGNKPIHLRLGHNHQKRQQIADRGVTHAKKDFHIIKTESSTKNPANGNRSMKLSQLKPIIISPLTKRSVHSLNKLNKSLSRTISSTPSLTLSQTINDIRHSAEKVVNNVLQEEIKGLEGKCKSFLSPDAAGFNVTPDSTIKSINERFLSYI